MPKESDLLALGLDLPSKLSQVSDRIFLKARQKTFGESVAADVYDDLLGMLPFLGDFVENAPRINDAIANEDILATAIHGGDFVLTLVPGVGTILNFVIPANTIIKGIEYGECKSSNKEDVECLFPDGSIERDILNFAL